MAFFTNAEKAYQNRGYLGGQERFLVKTFADGSEERSPIVKLPRKKRYPDRPYWHWDLDKGRKKGF
jgi:hypothetical protein